MGASVSYLLILAATLAVELPIVWWLAPRTARRPALVTALFANLVTHPLGNAALTTFGGMLAFGVVELLIMVAEYVAFRLVAALPVRASLRIAVLANAATIVLSVLFWW